MRRIASTPAVVSLAAFVALNLAFTTGPPLVLPVSAMIRLLGNRF